MKITLTRPGIQTLKKLVPWAGTGQYSPPALTHLLIQANGNATAMANNLAMIVEATIPATVWEDGGILLPPRVVEMLKDQEVIDLDATGDKVVLSNGDGRNKTTLTGNLDVGDFPIPKAAGDDLVFLGEVAAAELKAALLHVRGIPLPDGARSWERAIWILARNGQVLVAAADGFQLAVRCLEPSEPPAREVELLASAQLGRLTGLLEDAETVRLEAVDNALLLTTEPARLRVRAVREEGRLPAFENLVPDKDGATQAALPVGELRRALSAVAGFSAYCKLAFQEGSVLISTDGEDGAGRARASAVVSGTAMTMTVDARRLSLALTGAADKATATLYAREEHSPLLLEIAGSPPAGYDVIMPMSE